MKKFTLVLPDTRRRSYGTLKSAVEHAFNYLDNHQKIMQVFIRERHMTIGYVQRYVFLTAKGEYKEVDDL